MMEAAATKSMPELAQATTKTLAQSNRNTEQGYMPTTSEKKAKRGFLSMLGRKDKKSKTVSVLVYHISRDFFKQKKSIATDRELFRSKSTGLICSKHC